MDNINDEILDDNWVTTFDENDKLYMDFYKENVYSINIHFIYINNLDNIEKIQKKNIILLKPNYISKEEIIGILKKNSIMNNKKYTLLSILKYNITLNFEDINFFLNNNNNNNYNFLSPIKNIDSIAFDKTIKLFQNLNDLLFIFYEKTNVNEKENKTKKIYLYHNKINKNNKYNKTIRNI